MDIQTRNRIRHLEERNALLEEQNKQLQEHLYDMRDISGWIDLVVKCKLTTAEERVLRLLYKHKQGVITKSVIWAAMYSDRLDRDWPDAKIVDVWVCKLRFKLPDKTYIQTSWGRGYVLTPEGRAFVQNIVEPREHEELIAAASTAVARVG